MKNWSLFFGLFLLISCNNSAVEKPKNLIDEDQMVDIIYDISLLDAMRSQNFGSNTRYPTNTNFLKSKYKVDSLTFAKSSQYYASDYKKYKKMYEEVKLRFEEESNKINGGQTITSNPEQGVVK